MSSAVHQVSSCCREQWHLGALLLVMWPVQQGGRNTYELMLCYVICHAADRFPKKTTCWNAGRSPRSTLNVAWFFHWLEAGRGCSFFILSLFIFLNSCPTVPLPAAAGTHIGDVCLQLQHLHHFLPHTVVLLRQVPVLSGYLRNGNHEM